MPDLVVLYQRMSELTKPICLSGEGECARFTTKNRCCARQHCDVAAKFAKDKYGIELQATGHPTIPFMGDHGCTVAPHLRPHCTMQLCSVSWADRSTATPAYFILRGQILILARAEQKEPV